MPFMSRRITATLSLVVFATGAFAELRKSDARQDSSPASDTAQPVVPVSSEFDLAKRRREHWAWQPIQRPELPPVRDEKWVVDAIDRFILAKLEAAGLVPALPAAKRDLLRRVYFDLIGLPPLPHEVDAFVQDDSPDAFARVVDRLLASPHFGERWGRHWLDLVRYAETRGHEFDHIIPNAFQYRDYVIRALNADVPYSQFVTEHIAGDLMQHPRLHATDHFNESVLGTGFWCLGEELHSPVDIRGDEIDRMENKLDVFSKTFLGMTVACARCHDHKFDAISARDYYALAGFLLSSSYRQVPFESLDRNRAAAGELESLEDRFRPVIGRLVAETQRPAIARVARYLSAVHEVIQSREPVDAPDAAKSAVVNQVAARHDLDPAQLLPWITAVESARVDPDNPLHLWSLVAHAEKEDEDHFWSILNSHSERCASIVAKDFAWRQAARVILDFSRPEPGTWSQDGIAFRLGPVRPGTVRFSAIADRPIAEVIHFAAAYSDHNWDVLRVSSESERDPGKVSWLQSGRTLRTPTVTLSNGRLFYLVRGAGHAYAAVDSHRLIAGPLHGALVQSWDATVPGKLLWVEHDLTRYKGHRAHIEFSPKESKPGQAAASQELAVLAVFEADQAPGAAVSPSTTFFTKLVAAELATPDALAHAYETMFLQAIDQLASDKIIGSRDAEGTAWLASWLLQHPELFQPADPEQARQVGRAARLLIEQSQAIREELCSMSRTAPAMLDGSGVDEFVLTRGNHRTPGAKVARRFLEALEQTGDQAAHASSTKVHAKLSDDATPAFPFERQSGSGRMHLAQRVTESSNPLTARVMVNRVWHHLFGRGIVASVDNFGVLGEKPTHPELLDHLANRFVEQNWSLKCLIRQIVLSNAYRMSVHAPAESEAIDPENRLLHHMPLRRLEGEAIRDAVLAISGRLETRMFGPSVELQLTPFMEGRGRPDKSGPLDGNGRRSIYLRVRRNFPHPMFAAFDAPTPCTTIGRRSVSNVPAQALSLMNNDFIIAESKRWAHRMIAAYDTPQERIQQMFLAAFARPCKPDEATDALQFIAEQSERYRVVANTDPRPWEDLAHALMNAKELVFRQ
jgi:hypothetical protein